ncbi:elongation factor P hydroxylase [Proteobacteria bacterium 005FR1]|nr:elongation factor P hydroxylase [Proteobacteria bacterium 005FR1]
MEQDHHQADSLVEVFNRVFSHSHRTLLVAGGDEPLYTPARDDSSHHLIVFTRDYFASALHEVAHWCIAGPERRQLDDYGYWYAPDGRDQQQQRAFEQVEVKPQALEWIFSRSAGFRFRLSADNLDGNGGISQAFKEAVWRQAQDYCQLGLPERAGRFAAALADAFAVDDHVDPNKYRLEDLG